MNITYRLKEEAKMRLREFLQKNHLLGEKIANDDRLLSNWAQSLERGACMYGTSIHLGKQHTVSGKTMTFKTYPDDFYQEADLADPTPQD